MIISFYSSCWFAQFYDKNKLTSQYIMCPGTSALVIINVIHYSSDWVYLFCQIYFDYIPTSLSRQCICCWWQFNSWIGAPTNLHVIDLLIILLFARLYNWICILSDIINTRTAIEAIESVGGSITTVYFNQRTLQALLKVGPTVFLFFSVLS